MEIQFIRCMHTKATFFIYLHLQIHPDMKKIVFIIFIMIFTTNVFGQKIKEYKASNGITYKIGDEIKLGKGLMTNGGFMSIINVRTGNILLGGNLSLSSEFENGTALLKKIIYVNNANFNGIIFKVKIGNGIYKMYIEHAIWHCEIIDCNKNKDMKSVDEYKASNGITYKVGDLIQLGRGSGVNGQYVYVTLQKIDLSLNPYADQLQRGYAGLVVTIKEIKHSKFKKFEHVIFYIDMGDNIDNYVINIENAIATCEIKDCVKDEKPQSTDDKYNKLKKIKTLYDEGILTKGEYEAEKKKILESE